MITFIKTFWWSDLCNSFSGPWVLFTTSRNFLSKVFKNQFLNTLKNCSCTTDLVQWTKKGNQCNSKTQASIVIITINLNLVKHNFKELKRSSYNQLIILNIHLKSWNLSHSKLLLEINHEAKVLKFSFVCLFCQFKHHNNIKIFKSNWSSFCSLLL